MLCIQILAVLLVTVVSIGGKGLHRYPEQRYPDLIQAKTSKALFSVDPQSQSGNLPKSFSWSELAAKSTSYVIGLGAMTVYTPIIIKIIQAKDSSGYCISTWVYNLLGLSAATIYPVKRKFKIAAYVELIVLAVQSACVLSVVCFFQNKMLEFAGFMLAYTALVAAVVLTPIPTTYLAGIQISSSILCNYANVPQILKNYFDRKASWSSVTAALSVAGNLTRILTTLHFTKDVYVLLGYVLGFITNVVLLFQTWYYK